MCTASCDSIDKNRPEDDKSIAETCSLIITLSKKSGCTDLHYLILYYIDKNRPEDEKSIAETCSLIITLSNKVVVLTYTI